MSNITPEQFAKQYKELWAIVEVIHEDDMQPSLFYGYGEGSQFGWWEVVPDYPSWFNCFLGATFEDALKELNERLSEWEADQEEDEGEEEEDV